MDPLITMQCGPIREIADTSAFAKHPAAFITDEPGKDGACFQTVYTELAADIADAARRGRCCLPLRGLRCGCPHMIALASAS
ncbi:hypothetical protein SUDANB15_07500 (plasmid) [Streptomyces sp. enrichment culture]|uniref:hypothetical protein n=1 Tax=Streptomyces sp. enrichment culture TaxID=1795815 RepID=UPI003F547AC9